MQTAEARIATDRPSRYLVQLCEHVSAMGGRRGHVLPGRHGGHGGHGAGQGDGAGILHADWTDSGGVIATSWGRCTLRAAPGTLTLRAEAADEDGLRRMEDLLTARLERFGRRDRLTVTWRRDRQPDGQPDPRR